jgi:undecaprenyl-diphosphatase
MAGIINLGGWTRWFMRWLMNREAVVLGALLAVVGGLWGFSEIAGDVIEGDTQKIDEWTVRLMRRLDDPATPIGPKWLSEAALEITALGSITVLALVTFAVMGFLLLQKKSHAMWLVLGATVSGLAASTILKTAFARDRPEVVPHLTTVHTASFPSGHAMLSAVVYLTLGVLLARVERGWRVRAYVLGVALGLTFLVGVSRVYLGVHYPTDVLAGWTAGLCWAIVCWLVARWLQKRGSVEPPGPEPGTQEPPAGPTV